LGGGRVLLAQQGAKNAGGGEGRDLKPVDAYVLNFGGPGVVGERPQGNLVTWGGSKDIPDGKTLAMGVKPKARRDRTLKKKCKVTKTIPLDCQVPRDLLRKGGV